MSERDPLDALLAEWKSTEPATDFDRRVMEAYRARFPKPSDRLAGWRRLWNMRVSVPVPILIAAMTLLGLFFWYRSSSQSAATPPATGVVTRLNATGFQPLPNGEARVVPVNEVHQ